MWFYILSGSNQILARKHLIWLGVKFFMSRPTIRCFKTSYSSKTSPRCLTLQNTPPIGKSWKCRLYRWVYIVMKDSYRMLPTGDIRLIVHSSGSCNKQKTALKDRSYIDISKMHFKSFTLVAWAYVINLWTVWSSNENVIVIHRTGGNKITAFIFKYTVATVLTVSTVRQLALCNF